MTDPIRDASTVRRRPFPLADTSSAHYPTDVAQAAGPLNDWPLLGAQHQPDLDLAVPFVVEMSLSGNCEDRCLDKAHWPADSPFGTALQIRRDRSKCRHNARFQPRRRTIADAAVGCKSLLAGLFVYGGGRSVFREILAKRLVHRR